MTRPVSTSDVALFRKAYLHKLGPEMDRQRTIAASAAYKSADPETLADRPVEVAERIAQAIPDARLVTIQGCGHFPYLECADDVREAIASSKLFQGR